MASLSCVGYVDNKTLSYKAISGGSMKVGSLVREKYPNNYDVGFGIVIADFGKTVHVQWSNMTVLYVEHRTHLDILCK